MKTFWLVESRYCDDGATARCDGAVLAEERPVSEKLSTSEVDIYRDWCDSRAEADQMVQAVCNLEPVPLRRTA
jgi:hypothetical protein